MSDAGPKLDADALGLLDAFRQEEQIPDAVHDRVWDRVAADVARPSAGARSARWARRGAMLGVLAAAAVAVLWLGGQALRSDDARPSASQAGYERTTAAAGGVAEPRQPEPTRDRGGASPSAPSDPSVEPPPPEPPPPEPVDTAPSPVQASSRAKHRPPPTPVEPQPPPGGTLAEENRLLSRARAALIAEQPDRALVLLREHAERFTDGVLSEERRALRAVALCEAGHDAKGAKAAHAFLQAHPQATLARRVRTACLE